LAFTEAKLSGAKAREDDRWRAVAEQPNESESIRADSKKQRGVSCMQSAGWRMYERDSVV
jgi:hypothetical protein